MVFLFSGNEELTSGFVWQEADGLFHSPFGSTKESRQEVRIATNPKVISLTEFKVRARNAVPADQHTNHP